MIAGTVTANREAVLPLTIYSASGQPEHIDAIVDTGFTGWLTLPPALIASLGLVWRRSGRAILADGSLLITNIYEAQVLWDGLTLTVSVAEANADPLLGMSLLYGYELTMPVLDGSTFTIRNLAVP